ncbi:MAG: helix-turn-helix domain-containing protein [Clostridia bacterium]|nr:helix-turn-helix domain-containing protein [Clostridia bacterium]
MDENVTAVRLRRCREDSHETLEQIGALTGVNKSTVMRWERGDTSKINLPTLHLLAQHFHVNTQWLMGLSEDMDPPQSPSLPNAVPVPVMGAVRAGCGGAVCEEIIGTEPVDAGSLRGECDYFWLRVSGDSMTPMINDRDLVLVRRQEQVDSGRYAVVLVDGEEGLVKRVVYSDDWLELQSVNPYYPPRRFEGEQMSQVTIVGLVVESKRKYI